MKNILGFSLLLAVAVWAQDLAQLIEAAHKNDLVQTYAYRRAASQKAYDAAKSSYYPRVDLGASAIQVDPKGLFEPGASYTAYAKASVTLFDGFKRENLLKEKTAKADADGFTFEGYKKSLSLQVTQLYFDLKTARADIEAQRQTKKQLEGELHRLEKFYTAGIATEDDVERIKAALANANYAIVALEYEADTLASKLNLLTGLQIDAARPDSRIKPPAALAVNPLDSIRALELQGQTLKYRAEQADASYYPALRIEDTYSLYAYDDDDIAALGYSRPDHQNKIMLVFSMNLIDFSAAGEQRDLLMLQHKAHLRQLDYEQKSVNADLELAKLAITRAKRLIEAAEASVTASDKTFEAVEKKYRARVVDYVKYLDALTRKTEASAQYHRAVNSLYVAYARYYYYAGYDPKEFVE